MIIEPKVRGFICTTAHPAGCEQAVKSQIDFVRAQSPVSNGPKNVLIIGASTGYGLASRIVSTYACHAKTIGVFFEKSATDKRTASAGWYNTAAFEKFAHADGHYAKSINGDAFSDDIKKQAIDLIQEDLGQVDCVIYSLASPRRKDPKSEKVFSSCLKPVGQSYTNKTVDPMTGHVYDVSLSPAEQDDIAQTIAVMGGDDWALWMDALDKAGVLAPNVMTLAYTYVGPALTHAIYKNGTIGKAKDHLLETAHRLDKQLRARGGRALVSVNKAVVTQASSAIPVVPLYISILFKLMKARGTHEGCIEQIDRLFRDFMHNFMHTGKTIPVDEAGRIRIDDLEMMPDVQQEIERIWKTVATDNVSALTDIAGYRRDFYQLFGFEWDNVNYQADVNIDVKIPSIKDVYVE